MLVTITNETTDLNLNGTFRLKTWTTNTALPLADEWEKVGDLVVVATMNDRNQLINTAGTHTLHSLAPGTTVVVKANIIGVPETFIYAAVCSMLMVMVLLKQTVPTIGIHQAPILQARVTSSLKIRLLELQLSIWALGTIKLLLL